MNQQRLKIGAVSYLNTKPLVYELESLVDAEICFDLPSRLADRLVSGELDVALIPSIETFKNEEFSIVSDACIGCRGPVWSVKLLSRKPFDQIQSISVDEGSRTSIVLAQILLNEKHRIKPALSPLSIDDDPFVQSTDAVLIIGDRAMKCDANSFVHKWDLGEQWCNQMGCSFVFATWTARRETELFDLGFALGHARDKGVQNLKLIAEAEHSKYDMTFDQCFEYLSENLHFALGESELAGMEKYRQLAFKLGKLENNRVIEFHDCKRA